MPFEYFLLWGGVLTLASVIASKLSDKFAIPSLLIFLVIGMLAGSEGIGGIHFDNPQIAKSIGIIAFIFIIFFGGLSTNWSDIRPVIAHGIILSTAGVLFTGIIVGFFASFILKFSLLEGMLLGAIVSSTDATAVFSILRSKRISLDKPLKPLLEFESGSNDPMAMFLTIGFLSVLTAEDTSIALLIPKFLLDMGVGAFIGLLMARFIVLMLNRLKMEYEGLYPVMMISLVLMTYAIATILRGNGLLAVYLSGLMIARSSFYNRKTIIKFHDGLAWLMQIIMFLTLGLLVFPSHIVPVIGPGFLLAFILMFIARPISIFLCLTPFKISVRKLLMISWVGLRGAVPIILATFPLLAGMPQADAIFNIVFFVVITSVLVQGTSIPFVSKILRLDKPLEGKKNYPIEFEKTQGIDAEFTDVIVPYNSKAVGKKISELKVPEKCLIVLILRQDKYIIPSGTTTIEENDILLVLANENDLNTLYNILSELKE